MFNIKKQYINKSLKKLYYKHSKKKDADVAQQLLHKVGFRKKKMFIKRHFTKKIKFNWIT